MSGCIIGLHESVGLMERKGGIRSGYEMRLAYVTSVTYTPHAERVNMEHKAGYVRGYRKIVQSEEIIIYITVLNTLFF